MGIISYGDIANDNAVAKYFVNMILGYSFCHTIMRAIVPRANTVLDEIRMSASSNEARAN